MLPGIIEGKYLCSTHPAIQQASFSDVGVASVTRTSFSKGWSFDVDEKWIALCMSMWRRCCVFIRRAVDNGNSNKFSNVRCRWEKKFIVENEETNNVKWKLSKWQWSEAQSRDSDGENDKKILYSITKAIRERNPWSYYSVLAIPVQLNATQNLWRIWMDFKGNFAQNAVTFATKQIFLLGGENCWCLNIELCIITQNCFQQKIERRVLIPQLRKNIQINIQIPRQSLWFNFRTGNFWCSLISSASCAFGYENFVLRSKVWKTRRITFGDYSWSCQFYKDGNHKVCGLGLEALG